jgi:hypothetical protein
MALVALAGLDAGRFLRTRDPLEQEAVLAAAERAVELRQQLDRNLAVLIADSVGQVFGGKRG